MKKMLRIFSAFVATAMMLPAALGISVVAASETNGVDASESTSLSCTFKNDTPGDGEGVIVIMPSAQSLADQNAENDTAESGTSESSEDSTDGVETPKNAWYSLYFIGKDGVLSDYEPIATEEMTGADVEVTLPYGMLIPEEAVGIALFESVESVPDDLSLDSAVATYTIPEEKKLALGEAEFNFASVSDVHVNYTSEGGTYKWIRALNFFDQKDIGMVVVSGDLTGEGSVEEYQNYLFAISSSSYPLSQIYEARGNHDSQENDRFIQYTSGKGEVHPYPSSPYFYVLKEGEGNARDNLFIFMAQELTEIASTSYDDNFSDEQLDWLEGLLVEYSGKNTNIFIVEHAFMHNFGPGDRIDGDYSQPMMLEKRYEGNMRFKSLLTEYKEVIMMSGHSHLSLYELINYSDENGTVARMIHNGSTSQPRAYTASGSLSFNSEGKTTSVAGSEGYLVYVYEDNITYIGYDLTTGKIIPRASYLLEVYDESRSDAVSVSLKKAPDKTTYYIGETFDGSGMEIEATFADGSKRTVRGWAVSNVGELSADDTTVEISYGNVKETVKIPLTILVNEEKYPFNGKGSVSDPFLIETAEDFKELTDLFLDSKSEFEMYGDGIFFRQTADIDMTGVEGYSGIRTSSKEILYFAGIYDGGGYTLTVDVTSTGHTSIFPYVAGAIYNLVIRGRIESTTNAQPIKALLSGAVVANCDIAIDTVATSTYGLCGTNSGTVYNTYIHSTVKTAVCQTNDGGEYHNVYTNCHDTDGKPVLDDGALALESLESLANIFNDRTSDAATAGLAALDSVNEKFATAALSEVSVSGDTLSFAHLPVGITNDIVVDPPETESSEGGTGTDTAPLAPEKEGCKSALGFSSALIIVLLIGVVSLKKKTAYSK